MSVAMSQEEARTVAVVRSSGLVRALEWMLGTAIAAWRESVAGTASQQAIAWLQAQTDAGRARVAGGVTTVAAATALVLQRLALRPEPLIWIVPATFLIVGLCLLAASRERPAR
jgi:hypothetical protein